MELDCLSIENLIIWAKKIPKLDTLAFHVSSCPTHVVEAILYKIFNNVSLFGLPESLQNFHLSSAIYLGSFKWLEPLILFVLQSTRSKLKVLEVDLNLGIAVDNTEKLMQSF